MRRVRRIKLVRDLAAARTRVLLMIAALAVSIVALTALLTAEAVIDREVARGYLSTRPSAATIALSRAPTDDMLEQIRDLPAVQGVTRRASVMARMQVGDDRVPLLLFAIAPSDDLDIARFVNASTRWPIPQGTVLLERSTVEYFGLPPGEPLDILASGASTPATLKIAGSAHDPSLAPSNQEAAGYGYVTPETLADLGLPASLDEIKLRVEPAHDLRTIEDAARSAAAILTSSGATVRSIEVPPPLQHPHQGQLDAVVAVFMIFAVLALVLSAVLVAAMLNSLLTRHVRQIGALKAIGASRRKVFVQYLLFAGVVATAATVIAAAPGVWLGLQLSRQVAALLNIDLVSRAVPWWVVATALAAGVGVPLVVAAIPVRRASAITVRQALDHHGTADEPSPPGRLIAAVARRLRSPVLLLAVRNAVRRKGRLVLSVALLATAGTMMLSALGAAAGWQRLIDDGLANRRYDVQVTLSDPTPSHDVAVVLDDIAQVDSYEAVLTRPTAETGDGTAMPISRTYPDTGHGSFSLAAQPTGELFAPPLEAGSWPREGATDEIVLNQSAPVSADVGDVITLTTDGRSRPWRVVGIATDVGSQGTAYAPAPAVAAATGRSGQVNLLRIAITGDPADTLRRIDRQFTAAGIGIARLIPVTQLATALDGHIAVFIGVLLAIGVATGIVGFLGLGANMSANTVERTHDFGVMAAIGATPAAIRRVVTTEAVLTAAAGAVIAIPLAIPITMALGRFLGERSFSTALPVVIPPAVIAFWLLASLPIAYAATALAAHRASRSTIVDALAAL